MHKGKKNKLNALCDGNDSISLLYIYNAQLIYFEI